MQGSGLLRACTAPASPARRRSATRHFEAPARAAAAPNGSSPTALRRWCSLLHSSSACRGGKMLSASPASTQE